MLQTFAAITGFLGFMLVFNLVGVFGWAIALMEYAAVLSPKLSRPDKQGRVRRRWGDVLGLIFGLVVVLVVYSVPGNYLGQLFNERLSLEKRHTIVPIMVAAIYVLLGARQLWSHRLDYLAFRHTTSFRMWLRSLPGCGIEAAHEYYFAGWRFRAVSQAFSLTSGLGVWFVAIWMATPQSSDSIPLREWQWLGVSVGAAITFALMGRIVMWIWGMLRPDSELASLCTNVTAHDGHPMKAIGKKRSFKIFRPGEWRSQSHVECFRAADLVERCVRSMVGRLAPHHFDKITLAARQIAQSLRLNALQSEDEQLQERKFYALQLVTRRNPVEVADKIAELTRGEPEPPPLPRRRAAHLAEAVSEAINQHWPALKIILAIGAIVLLTIFGKYTDVVGLLKP